MKTLLFDLDDTILDFHWAEAQALRRALQAVGIAPNDQIVARYSAINQRQWELLEEKKLTREQVLIRRFQLLFGELGVDASCQAAQDNYERFLGEGHRFLPGAEAVLALLYPRYDLYLVSNGTACVQDSRLKSAGISHYFGGVFISERLGADKPQKAFFDRCFAAIGNPPRDEAMIIGDSLTSDIRGGNNAGIRTCWYNPHGKPRREDIHVDWEISDLLELPGLLEAL